MPMWVTRSPATAFSLIAGAEMRMTGGVAGSTPGVSGTSGTRGEASVAEAVREAPAAMVAALAPAPTPRIERNPRRFILHHTQLDTARCAPIFWPVHLTKGGLHSCHFR